MGKEEWAAQSARKKMSRAKVVLTAAKLAKDDAAQRFGKDSKEYRDADDNFSKAAEASERVKRAYAEYALRVTGKANSGGVTVETKGDKVLVTMPKNATSGGAASLKAP